MPIIEDIYARLDRLEAKVFPAPVPTPEPEPTPEPTPAPQPAPVPASGSVMLLGSAVASLQHRVGPADRATLSDLEAAIKATPKWSVFANAVEEISPSRNGVRVPSYVKLHVWGNMNGLYQAIPRLVDGVARTEYHNQQTFGDFMPLFAAHPTKAGPRGVNVMAPQSTWHGHTRKKDDGTLSMSPHVPLYLGIQMDGWMVSLQRDGSFYRLAQIPGVKNAHDFTYSPDRKVFYVADTDNGRVLKVDRHDAFDASGRENFEKWKISALATGLKRPTSVRSPENGDGSVFVAEADGHCITRIAPDGARSKLADLPYVFWLDYDSHGRIVALTRGLGLHAYELGGGAHEVLNVGDSGARNWVTVSVDRSGTFGPKDEMTILVGGNGNTTYARYQDGVLRFDPLGGSGGYTTIGEVGLCQDPFGHYVWTAEHHPDEALLLVQGTANVFPSLIAARPANYPEFDVYDHGLFGRGRGILRYGTVNGAQIGTKPSFTCQVSEGGWSLLGCTFDMIAEKSFADAAAFVQQGMFGSFPRPEIKGLDLYAILYVIYRSSQRWLREGKALMDALKAFCEPMFGQELPPIPQRVASNPERDIFIDAVLEGDVIKLKGTKYYYGHPVALPDTLTARVVLDKGLPEQQDLGALAASGSLPKPSTTVRRSLFVEAITGVADSWRYFGRATLLET
jgi:hypothetical protein